MLNAYLGLQQQALDEMGKERQRLRELAQREELRAFRLQEVIASLGQGQGFHPLLLQNRQQMDAQLRRLHAHQVQQSAMARLDLDRHELQLRQQFGRVKGLEGVLDRRALADRRLRESQEQRQLDEISSLRHRTRGS